MRRNALYSSNTMLNEQGWIHRCLNAVKNKQGSPHLCKRVWITYMEIVDAVTKMKINFMCQQKTMWVDEKAKELDSSRYKH
ncbi:hypothetical protein MTR_5g024860 [Medicago truncatula]|uniref:Uncharacterized protein n=1 Tax=Medicago truncatula TaxID=3880 RepID=A0A072UP58_MEDTR|nr:hypothetical protein MTR_5g024860 [Medicago truncatula]